MPSQSACFHVLAACLRDAQRVGSATTGEWLPRNDDPVALALQERFVDLYLAGAVADLPAFKEGEFDSVAALDAGTINAFLAAKGYQIALDPFVDPDDFGVAAVMNVGVLWATPGTESTLVSQGVTYPAAKLEEGVTYTRTPDGTFVAHVACAGGEDTLHICVAPGYPEEQSTVGILERVVAVHDAATERAMAFDHLKFPMVDLDHEVDVSFFKGLGFYGVGTRTGRAGTYRCLQAKQQTKFRMNHLGARAESAAAMGFGLECFRPPLVIDKPFFVWITRKGMNLPVFAAYVDREDWKAPASV
jgi:hypothetical protein